MATPEQVGTTPKCGVGGKEGSGLGYLQGSEPPLPLGLGLFLNWERASGLVASYLSLPQFYQVQSDTEKETQSSYI